MRNSIAIPSIRKVAAGLLLLLLTAMLFWGLRLALPIRLVENAKRALPGRENNSLADPPASTTWRTLQASQAYTAYLPLVPTAGGSGALGRPIWPLGETQPGVVALFRRRFEIASAVDKVELAILADTRYEAWLDGEWLGRGPARFSELRQEFDTLTHSGLSPGPHVLAVLVQYAPNTRRSADLGPALQAGLKGRTDQTWQHLVHTDGRWRATISAAWDANAAPVSELGLIGPLELLDLRQLPADWMQPFFDDASWPQASVLASSPFPALSPRTIPQLANIPRLPLAVVEKGLLSPGRQIVEFQHPTGQGTADTQFLTLTAPAPATLRLEGLTTAPVRVDGASPVAWQALNQTRRPDVVVAQQAVEPGRHTLSVAVPPEGRTLALYTAGIQLDAAPAMALTHNPGRRTLLAEPSPGGETVPIVHLLSTGAEIEIPAGETPRYVVLDFGRTVHARLDATVEGPAGTIVDIGWDERLTAGRPLPAPGSLASNLWRQVDSWLLDGTSRHLTTLDARAGRYLLLQVFGPGPVYFHQLRALEETYPATPGGWFTSSDPLLDEAWQVGVNGLIPNMTDAYTDTPWRERGQWWGDAVVSFHINRAALGDLALLRRGLRQMADAIDPTGRPAAFVPRQDDTLILDYGMLWIESLHLYWQLSGNAALVAELYPAAQRLMGFLATYEGTAGLLDVAPAHWSQSALVDWAATTSRSGQSTALNALYAANLRQMAEMAQALGRSEQAQAYREKSQSVRESLNQVLFMADQRCYAASRLDGQLIPPSPHAQAWALRYDVVPAGHRPAVARCLIEQLEPFYNAHGFAAVEIYGMFWTLDALAQAGRTDVALQLIREHYGHLLAQGTTTWWELFTPNQGRSHSLSHAWGGAPTWFLSAHVLGAQATGPATWRLAPQPGDLAQAQGGIPMPTGVLQVAWQRPACGQFQLSLTAPAQTSGDVTLPVLYPDAHLLLDGVTVWDDGPLPGSPVTVTMTPTGLHISDLAGGFHGMMATFECYHAYLPLILR